MGVIIGGGVGISTLASTTVPGGIEGSVQFNEAGAFGGTTSLTFNSTTGELTATSFIGDGLALTNLNASNLLTGTVGTARLGSGTPSSSNYLRGDGTWATVSALPGSDLAFAIPGNPVVGKLCLVAIVRSMILPINLNGSVAASVTAPTVATQMTIHKRTAAGVITQIGTINFAAGANAGTFTFASAQSFATGDIVYVNLAVADATFADVAVTLVATTS